MNQIKKCFNRLTIQDGLFFIGFLLVTLLCLWKVPLEIQGSDEAFYLTIPKRLLDNDIFLADEWNLSQFCAVLSFPLVWLHRLFFGFDAIVLHFRYIYVFFQALCSIAIYGCFRKHGLFAVLSSLYFYIFTPYDIMTLSYNTMGLMLVSLTCTVLAIAVQKKTFFFCGILFAGAVLCCPYLIAGFVFYSIATLIYSIKIHNKDIVLKWLSFIMGGGICAVLLVVFILTRASFSELWRSIPMIFTDPTHIPNPAIITLKRYVLDIFRLISYGGKYGKFNVVIYGIAFIMAVIDKRRSDHKLIYLGVSIVVAIIMLIKLIPIALVNDYNSIMFPLAPVGLMAFIVTEQKDNRVFLFTFLGGMTYTLCIFFTSNQGSYILTAMSTAANIGSIILIGFALKETKKCRKLHFQGLAVMLVILFIVQYSLMIYTKINHKFWSNADNSSLTQVIQEGPYKGIHVTPETEAVYIEQLEMLSPMSDKEGSVLFVCLRPWYYLAIPELSIGAYSSWIIGVETNIERLDIYYSYNPDKIPDYIFVPAQTNWNMTIMKERILDKYGYIQISVDDADATIYSRNPRRSETNFS